MSSISELIKSAGFEVVEDVYKNEITNLSQVAFPFKYDIYDIHACIYSELDYINAINQIKRSGRQVTDDELKEMNFFHPINSQLRKLIGKKKDNIRVVEREDMYEYTEKTASGGYIGKPNNPLVRLELRASEHPRPYSRSYMEFYIVYDKVSRIWTPYWSEDGEGKICTLEYNKQATEMCKIKKVFESDTPIYVVSTHNYKPVISTPEYVKNMVHHNQRTYLYSGSTIKEYFDEELEDWFKEGYYLIDSWYYSVRRNKDGKHYCVKYNVENDTQHNAAVNKKNK